MPISSYRQQLSVRAAARRKRLANIVSPEFQIWFDRYIEELEFTPLTEFNQYVLARTRGRSGVCLTPQPRLDSEPKSQPSSLSLIRKSQETDPPGPLDHPC